ncbi:MAG: hypothetical protein COS85_23900, partial [Armatimonadetes bacterium CG07_land_8_20_14_0_80_59_28]
ALAGIIGIYGLAREHRMSDRSASVVALALLSSPLYLRFSYTFMTDVPFLSCLIVSLLLYTRALRCQSYPTMLLASVTAAAAILVRQFGVALIMGILILCLSSRQLRRNWSFVAVGIALPSIAAVWQFWSGVTKPNWAMAHYVRPLQVRYISDVGNLVPSILWRLSVILPYLAFFLMPLAAAVLLVFLRRRYRRESDADTLCCTPINVMATAVPVLLVSAGLVYGVTGLNGSWLMPYLPWNLEILKPLGAATGGVLTAFLLVGGILFGRVFIIRYIDGPGWMNLSPHERLLDWVTLFLLFFQLMFLKIGDEYLLIFLPYSLVVVARFLDGQKMPWRRWVIGAHCAVLVVSAMWVRGLLEAEEAQWLGGEHLRTQGISPQRIHGSRTWDCYYGAFNEYLAEVGTVDPHVLVDDFFSRFIPGRIHQADYLVTQLTYSPDGERWSIVEDIPYRSMLFHERHVYVAKRQGVQ